MSIAKVFCVIIKIIWSISFFYSFFYSFFNLKIQNSVLVSNLLNYSTNNTKRETNKYAPTSFSLAKFNAILHSK